MERKILLVGNLTLDRNTTEKNVHFDGVGGSVYFAGRTAKNVGAEVDIISPFGHDFPTASLSGLHLINSATETHHPVIFHNINKPGGERDQKAVVKPGHDHYDLGNTLEFTPIPDVVLVCPVIDNITVEDVSKIRSKFSHALFILQPQGLMREIDSKGKVHPKSITNEKDMIDFFDFVIFSEKDIPNDWREKALTWRSPKRNIIVTQSEKGCTIFQADREEVRIEALTVDDIVDSTGSGDNFAGAFAVQYPETQSVTEACKVANAVAGYSLRFRADQLQYTANDIKAFAKEQGRDIRI